MAHARLAQIIPAIALAAIVASAGATSARASTAHPTASEQRERDRASILAMAGTYKVTFDRRELVSLTSGYEIRPEKVAHGDEVILVVENTPTFIRLQHILVFNRDGKESTTTLVFKDDGKSYPVSGNLDFDAVSAKRVDALTINSTQTKAGVTVGTAVRTVSKDGKTLTFSQKGTHAGGSKYEDVSVYDRQ